MAMKPLVPWQMIWNDVLPLCSSYSQSLGPVLTLSERKYESDWDDGVLGKWLEAVLDTGTVIFVF